MPRGRQRLDYIALRVEREPLDQIDLSNGLDASSKAVENRHSDEADRWGPQVPGGPTCQGVALRFGDVASGPF